MSILIVHYVLFIASRVGKHKIDNLMFRISVASTELSGEREQFKFSFALLLQIAPSMSCSPCVWGPECLLWRSLVFCANALSGLIVKLSLNFNSISFNLQLQF